MSTHNFRFRTQWLGYDRTEVNRFLDQVAADRQLLKDRLNYLEVIAAKQGRPDEVRPVPRRELEEAAARLDRLRDLGREMATCLKSGLSVLEKAHGLLSVDPGPAAVQPAPNVSSPGPASQADEPEPIRAAPLRRRLAYAGLAVLAVSGGVVTAVTRVPAGLLHSSAPVLAPVASQPRPSETTRSEPAAVAPRVPELPPAPVSEETPPAAEHGIALMITASSPCWIRSVVDGSHAVERLMQPGETFLVWGREEVLLRAGDGAALTVTINGQAAAPLGRAGQVVTRRITRENLKIFLQDQA